MTAATAPFLPGGGIRGDLRTSSFVLETPHDSLRVSQPSLGCLAFALRHAAFRRRRK